MDIVTLKMVFDMQLAILERLQEITVPPQWYTAEDVAKLLQLTPDAIRRMFREGRIPGANFGHKIGWRISKEDLEAFYQARKTT
jgi:excisionase family DNA binding protein